MLFNEYYCNRLLLLKFPDQVFKSDAVVLNVLQIPNV